MSNKITVLPLSSKSENVESSWKLQVAIESLLDTNVVKNVALLMSWQGWSAQHVTWKCPEMSAEPLSLGGISNNRREEAPLTKVINDMKTLKSWFTRTYFKRMWNLKFPILSATNPAKGGPMISATGMTPLTRATWEFPWKFSIQKQELWIPLQQKAQVSAYG